MMPGPLPTRAAIFVAHSDAASRAASCSTPQRGLSKPAAIRMAIATARTALTSLDGKLDASMVVNREVL